MKKKILFFSLVLAAIMSLLSSCAKDTPDAPEQYAITIRAKLPEGSTIESLEGIAIEFLDLRTQQKVEKQLDKAGVCSLSLDASVYTITIRGEIGNNSIVAIKENYSIAENTTLELPLIVTKIRPSGLLFKEVFFNGETNNGQMMHPDQYFVIYNNSDKVVYADGVAFGLAAHANVTGEDAFTEELTKNNRIVLSMIYTIPGNGSQYPIQPGGQLVIAGTAINHHDAEHPNSVDLSGADLEVYEPDQPANFGQDVDNPNVPNMVKIFNRFGVFMMHPRGFIPPVLFEIDEPIETFLAKNQFEYTNNDGENIMLYAVPVENVLDGIETGNTGNMKVKSLPVTVDKSMIGVPGCHRGILILRKTEEKNGRTYMIDTNDSENDCIARQGQNSFPARF
ncbi:DUF4876 domain-containing protein [Porphyromonas gingivalis]|uniref:DUF4876 domain-containing protein n=1 Tax=Porphyromonas gingivalis TaxID=837 RepID=UPI0024E01349|nr:DUF4876 domain-containing protein [Porphyromonas gingivalis]WIM92296.1 DUF4876 domain-containing protein [Porphyromonas gingivalis]